MTVIDARCFCNRCVGRTEDIYRMVGRCSNCGTDKFLIIYRSGDPVAKQDCPCCGCHTVNTYRKANDEEIPLS